MIPFNGFSEEVFECVEPSERIREPIEALKELQLEIEPELKKINPALIGHVCRTKKQGTNEYNDWAWLYFNTLGTGGNKYSQLTVNLSPTRMYVGVYLKTPYEYQKFREEIEKVENRLLFEQMLETLSGREWIIPIDGWEEEVARRYSVEELRGILLYPHLFWVNACFEKNEPILRTRNVADEVVQIFKELYNIYAFASGNQTSLQPDPKYGVFEQEMFADIAESPPTSDEESASAIRQFLSSLETTSKHGKHHLPKKNDQYSIKRKALEFDLDPYELDLEGKKVVIYSDKDINPLRNEILGVYPAFSKRLDQIKELLHLPEGFLRTMFVNPISDARYTKSEGSSLIFINLARFESNENLFFWLFTVSRELAYIKAHKLGYEFINQMRDILTVALNNLQLSESHTK
jgi:FtsZ-binding cell division protein ZapB